MLKLFLLVSAVLSAAAASMTVHRPHHGVVFLAPHPDDEALYSGAIFQTLQNKGEATVIYLSNGESLDAMAKDFLLSSGFAVPERARERVQLYESIRKREAEAGLASIEQITGRAVKRDFYDIENIASAIESEHGDALAGRLATAFRDVIARTGELALYVPHPRDTHPGHRATYELTRRALALLSVKERYWTRVYSYMVHFGSNPRQSGLTEIGGNDRREFEWIFDKEKLQEIPASHLSAVYKLETLLAHKTQLERDDGIGAKSPLVSGYLASFATLPEVYEELPSEPRLMPAAKGNLLRRGLEYVHRFIGARTPALSMPRLRELVRTLTDVALRALPAKNRAVDALLQAESATYEVANRELCQRALKGPWKSRMKDWVKKP